MTKKISMTDDVLVTQHRKLIADFVTQHNNHFAVRQYSWSGDELSISVAQQCDHDDFPCDACGMEVEVIPGGVDGALLECVKMIAECGHALNIQWGGRAPTPVSNRKQRRVNNSEL